jgi:hypothetical protein
VSILSLREQRLAQEAEGKCFTYLVSDSSSRKNMYRAGGMTQVINLPSKWEALSSNPRVAKKKKKRKDVYYKSKMSLLY